MSFRLVQQVLEEEKGELYEDMLCEEDGEREKTNIQMAIKRDLRLE